MKAPILFAILFASASTYAQQPPAPPSDGGGREHRGPPKEALEACKGKKEGDAASARTPRGDTVTGTCRLMLVPTNPPERH